MDKVFYKYSSVWLKIDGQWSLSENLSKWFYPQAPKEEKLEKIDKGLPYEPKITWTKDKVREKALKKLARREKAALSQGGSKPELDNPCPECLTENYLTFPSDCPDCQTCLKLRIDFIE